MSKYVKHMKTLEIPALPKMQKGSQIPVHFIEENGHQDEEAGPWTGGKEQARGLPAFTSEQERKM